MKDQEQGGTLLLKVDEILVKQEVVREKLADLRILLSTLDGIVVTNEKHLKMVGRINNYEGFVKATKNIAVDVLQAFQAAHQRLTRSECLLSCFHGFGFGI